MVRDRVNRMNGGRVSQQAFAVALRDWLYPDEISPGQRVRCQLPGCHALLGHSGQHLRFRSLLRSDTGLPPEWVGWYCSRCGHLNVYCPIE
jgi:hypothetical protein